MLLRMNDDDQKITDVLSKVEYRGQPASPAEIEKLDRLTKNRLPRLYLSLLLQADGVETSISINPYDGSLAPVNEVIDWLSDTELVPDGFIRIGGHDGEMILFDMRKEPPWVVSLPMMAAELEYLYLIATSFSNFLDLLCEQSEPPEWEEIEQLSVIHKCAVMLNAEIWTEEEVPDKIEQFELNKYAPEYIPIAKVAGPSSTFIGIKKSDGTVWEVPFLGTDHLSANRLADSLEQLHDFTAQIREKYRNDEWRYYESSEHL